MKLRLNTSLRRALMAAMAVATTLASSAYGGVVDGRYDLQYYLDFCRNKGMFAAGATNIEVFFKDGTSINNNVIPLMPNLDSFGEAVSEILPFYNKIGSNGGTNLVSSQFVYGAKHVHAKVGNTPVAFLSENGSASCVYNSANLDNFGTDSAMQRLTKLVTAVAYTPMATDEFMSSLSLNDTWFYRLGNGGYWCDGKSIATGDNALGGVVNLSVLWQNTGTGEWYLEGWARKYDQVNDTLTPLDVGTYFGDSGSPFFAWDDEHNQFLFVGAMFAGGCQLSFPNWYLPRYNYQQGVAVMDKYTVGVSFTGTDTIYWNTQDAVAGTGTLSQGTGDAATSYEYIGTGTGNTIADAKGLTFSVGEGGDAEAVREIQLQGSVNMGAGALTFEDGKWSLTELADYDFSLTSAGLEIKDGAEVTWELTGVSGQEIRKVGEGILTISGEGDNVASLVVGGGTTVYDVTRDAEGNIIACTLGNKGETRLNRTNGYAASSVRLEGGVAIIVLMADEQFKTNSTAGDTFSFGNAGGLLNLNGHDLTWGVINQYGSGTGARIGNFTPSGLDTPADATFTYTGTGTFQGCFMDEAGSGKGTARLSVVYNNATDGATWILTGQSTNAGGFTVQDGTLKLEGTRTPHVRTTDWNDWTYASIRNSDVTVQNGAAFHLSHHALMEGNVTVESGGSFILNQTVNAASESISGSLRKDMAELGITSLIGNVTLNGTATMTVETNSPVATTMQGNITTNAGTTGEATATFTKTGTGTFIVEGQMGYVSGTVEAGGLVITDATNFGGYFPNWTIGEQGFMAVQGMNAQTLAYYLKSSSTGVMALTSDYTTGALDLSGALLYIGAYGDEAITYGSADLELDANANGQWLLGGGTGTLNVAFKLTGDNDLIIGNEYSSGTVHLTNTANSFTGDIYIKGTGNMLTYEVGALGGARVALSYGNILGLNDASQLDILKENPSGILALTQDMSLNLTGKNLSIAAAGDLTLTQAPTVSDDTYRFGGRGNLTLDTDLSAASNMELDGQGNTGSSVTFARKDAFTGTITAGGGLHLNEANADVTNNSTGDIAIHVDDAEALAKATAVNLQKGAILHTDGQNIVVNNLSADSGSSIRNQGETASLLQLNVGENVSTSIANGVLNDVNNTATLSIVKTGTGTLEIVGNTSWSGGLTIMEGTVKGSVAYGGIGAAGASIYVKEGATLQMASGATTDCKTFDSTILQQKLTGDGEVAISNGNDMLFLTQAAGFEGTVKVTGNTRLYVTSGATLKDQGTAYTTSTSFDKATIVVENGSQARLTPSIFCLSGTVVNSWANYVISGGDYMGGSNNLVQREHDGALVVDSLATVWGNVTLADDAMIASWSHNPSESQNYTNGYAYRCLAESSDQYANRYGIINKLGGIIRGQILGVVEEDGTMTDLTLGGTEGITITADSANTFEDLIIANGNSKNYDTNKIFALQLDGGAARSQVSQALGTGEVTLNDGLILRLAGTGSTNSDIVYTYENTIHAGEGATLQSYYITNRLTSAVDMGENTTLNLATANGGVLELAGGVNGSGTLHVAADSKIVLGSAAATMALARSGSATFSGTVESEAGADITLASPSAVATDAVFTGVDTLTLRFGCTEDYTLGRIELTGSDITDSEGTVTGQNATTLTLHFNFTDTLISASDETTYSTLTATNGISANSTQIAIDMNMFEVLEAGNYTLINDFSGTYALANNTSDGRLSLGMSGDNLVLTVAEDTTRLYWSATSATHDWNETDANWKKAGNAVVFTAGSTVVLDATGVADTNDTTARETITLNTANQSVGTVNVLDACYEITGTYALAGSSLKVGSYGDLKLSTDATFAEVAVENGSLTVSDSSLTLTNEGATGTLTAGTDASVVLEKGTTLTGNVTMQDTADVQVLQSSVTGNIAVNGTGTLSLDAATLTGELKMGTQGRIIAGTYDGTTTSYAAATLSGDVVNGSGCTLTLDDGTVTVDGAVSLDAFTISAGKTATVLNSTETIGQSKVFGTLTLGNGATLAINNRIAKTSDSASIGTLVVDTAATIKEVQDAGQLKISTLKLADGVDSATLTITKDSKNNGSAYTSMLDLGSATAEAGNFAGKIVLNNTKGSTNNNHSIFINVYNKDILANTVVSMGKQECTSGLLGLGISTDGVQIAGLETQNDYGNRVLVFSGNAPTDRGWNTNDSDWLYAANDDATRRTLTINTASDTEYTYTGQFCGNLNLVKQGEGTQKFHGSSTGFNGSISIGAGTVAFNAAGSSMLDGASGLTVADGATLDLSAITFGIGEDTTNTIVLASGAEFAFEANARFALGNMESGLSYNVFDATNGTLVGWDTETLSVDNFTLDGLALSEYGRTVWLEFDAGGTFTYHAEVNDLVWTGAESGGTWDREQNNTPWTQILGDSVSEEATYFVNFDNVIFKSNAEVAVADGMTVGSLTVQDNATATLNLTEGTSLSVSGAIQVQAGATLALQGGEYALSDDIGSAEYTGTVALSGTALDFGTAVRNIAGEVQVLGDTTITSNRNGEDYDNSGVLNINGKLSVGANNTLTLDGNGRVVLAAGAEIALADGATMQRTAGGAYWLRGKLSVAEGATASFTTTDSIHFNYDNTSATKAAIELAANSKLTIQAASLSIYDGASTSISLAEGSQLTFSGFTLAGYTAQNVTGSGKLVLGLTNAHGNLLQLGAGFEGETYVSSGYFTMTGAQVGSKLTLGNNTEYQTTATAGTTVAAAIVLEGATKVHANGSKPITYTGSVTGNTYKSAGSSTHTFNGVVDLTAFDTEDVANVTFNAKTDIDTLTVDYVNDSNVGAVVNATGETTIGTFAISNNTTANFSGATTITTANIAGGTSTFAAGQTADITTATISGGTNDFNGTTTIATASVTGGTTTFNGDTSITEATFGGGTVNFATDSLTMGNITRNSGNINFKLAADATATTYSIGAITGNNNGTLTVDDGVSLTVDSIWTENQGHSGSLSVAGELNVTHDVHFRYGGDTFTGTGVINIGGNMELYTWSNTTFSVQEMNVAGNLTLTSYNSSVNMTNGVVTVEGALSPYSWGPYNLNLGISGASLVLKGNSNLNSGRLTLSAGKLEQAGGSSTISNTFTMSGGELAVSGGSLSITSNTFTMSGGELAVSGGSLSITSTPTVSGGAVSVSGGTLSLTDASAAAILGTTGGVSLTGGVLDLSSVTSFTADGSGIALGGAMSISGGTVALGGITPTANTTYTIFDFSADGASLDNWDKSYLSINGLSLLRYAGATVAKTDGGTATISFSDDVSIANYSDLLWVGGETGAWDHSTTNWDRTGDDADTHFSFVNGDSVTFNSSANVTLSEAITAGSLTVALPEGAAEGSTIRVSLDESAGALSATSITVGAGATLAFATKTSSASTSIGSHITGAGIVELNLCNTETTHWGNKITMGSGFTGEVHLNSGRMTLDGSSTGSKLVLLTDAADIQLTTTKNSATSWAGNLELRGTHDLHSNGSTDFTFTGNVSGTGTYVKCSSGTLTFGANGTVNLGKFSQSDGTTTFAGTTTLAGLASTGGTVAFSGTAAISGTASATALNVTGGSMKVNFTGANGKTITDNSDGRFAVTTLNHTGGTLEMSGTVNITTLNIGAGLTATVYNNGAAAGANKTFGTVKLGDGASFITYDSAQPTVATKLGTVQLTGTTATIQDKWNSGYTQIDNLVGGADATLNLVKYATSTAVGIYALGSNNTTTDGSVYAGTIALKQTGSNQYDRAMALLLNHATVAQKTTIDLNSHVASDAHIGLGVNVTSATIGGLNSGSALGDKAILFSGSQTSNGGWVDKSTDSTRNALTINTAAEKVHNFYGQVQNVNLVIDGEGTQNFLGTSSNFTGTVTVQGGTVGFNAAGSSLLEGATAFTLSGTGELDLSAITFGTDATNAIALKSGASFTFSDTLDNDGGLVIDLGALAADTTYQIFDLSAGNTTLTGWNLDTLDLANFRINGSLLSEMDNAGITLGESGTFSYTLTNENAPDVLYWVGGETGTWNTTDAVWDLTPDDTTDANTTFSTDAHVAFNSSAAVDIAGTAQAASVAVEGANTTLSLKSGNLTVADMYLEGTLDMASGVTLTVNNTEEVSISGITGSGKLVKNGTGSLELGDAELHTLDFTLNDDSYAGAVGELNITGTVTISDTLRMGDGTLTIGAGGSVTTKVFQGVANGKNGNSVINIEGGSLTITGSDDVDGEGTDFILGWWNNNNTSAGRLTLTSGSLTAENTSLYMGYDSPGVFKALGGEATLKGIRFRANDADADQFELGEATSGSAVVTIGCTGIVGMGEGDIIKLGEGTLKASADFAITAQSGVAPSVSLIGTANGTKFDTNGHNITVNTVLTGAGKLVKNGEGDLTFTAANTYTGATTINSGSIVLDLASKNDAGEITATGTYTLAGTVSGAGTLEVATGTTLVNDSKEISADLKLNGGDATINGDQMLRANVIVNKGSTLTTTNNDAFYYSGTHNLTVAEGGVIAMGANRQTMGGWTLHLTGGEITGAGAAYSSAYVAAIDYHEGTTHAVNATSGDSEIAATTGMRQGTLAYNVSEGATLTVSGAVQGTGAVSKSGKGDLTFSALNTYSGTTTITEGKLILDLGAVTTGEGDEAVTTNSVYTLKNTVSGAGTLEVESGTTLVNAGKIISADLVLNGGNATLKGGSKQIQGDITVKSGSLLTFDTASTSDTLNYGGAQTLRVEAGGKVNFDSTRQTMGGWTIELTGGHLYGAGQDQYGAIDYHNLVANNGAHEINALSGNSVIDADIRLRYKDNSSNKQDVKLQFDVGKNATLMVNGQVHSDAKNVAETTVAGYGSIIKNGDGKLIMTAANTYGGTTTISAGTLELQGTGKLGAGDVSIAAGAKLTAATTPVLDDAGNVTTESETWASVTSTSDTAAATVSGAKVTQTEATKTLSIASRSTDGTKGTMTNSLVQIAADASLTVDSMIISASSRLSGTPATYAARSLESSTAQLTLTNSVVELGDGNAERAGESTADSLTLQAVGSSAETLNLTGGNKILTIDSTALSSLTLTAGSSFVVDFSALLSTVELTDVDFVAVNFADVSYADDFWTSATTQVSGLVGTESMVAYYMPATPNVGMYFDVRSIPEPTTTTLSILALAALAARRRRK